MCQGCEDMAEFEAIVDAYTAEKLPELMAQPLDHEVLWGPTHG